MLSEPAQEFLKTSVQNLPPGDIVEVGCFQGGSASIIIKALPSPRHIWLYDTFQGMPPPSPEDYKLDHSPLLGKHICPKDQVRNNLSSYNPQLLHTIEGLAETTIPRYHSKTVAYLHIDCDYYHPTYTALKTFVPRMPKSAIININDYHSWHGSHLATNQYLPSHKKHRIDRSAVFIELEKGG